MADKDTIRVYEPDGLIKRGIFSLWHDMLREMFSSREHNKEQPLK
jgi:hypothetical protein